METIVKQPARTYTRIAGTYNTIAANENVWTRFLAFCKGQEKNRLMWLGIILTAHGCILTPMVVMLTLVAGPNFYLFMTGMVAMGIALVTNLAAMPTKVTIPAFALSVLIDLFIVAACVMMLLA